MLGLGGASGESSLAALSHAAIAIPLPGELNDDSETGTPRGYRFAAASVTHTLRKFRTVIAAVVLGIAMTLGGFFLARASVHFTDGQLLRQDAAQGSLVLNTVVASLTSPYKALGATIPTTGETPAAFTSAASALAADSGSAVALLDVTGGHVRVVSSVGPLHHSFGTPAADASVVGLGARPGASFAGIFTASGKRWLQEVYSKGYVPSGYLLYSEAPISKVGAVTQLPGILFSGATGNVFVGSVSPANIVLQTSADTSTNGQVALSVINTSNELATDAMLTNDAQSFSSPGQIIVAMSESGNLSGNFVPLFPWAILIIGLIATAGMTALLTSVVRRRDEALVLVSDLEVKNNELDEALVRQAQAEHRLRQAQRMEAVGQLAGGIAHDFNNLLQAIVSYSEFISDAIGPESEVQRDVQEVQKAANRAADLTRQLLVFSRQDATSPTVLNVPLIVLDSERFLRRTIGEDVTLTCEATKEPCFVVADASEIEMILMNLAINARDAMPQGGSLKVMVNAVQVNDVTGQELDLEPGRYVRIDVTDSGEGMSPEVAAKAFEPFFTTKETGRGTGLGLSMVYGIAKRSGGTAIISTTPGGGTTVTLLLPRSNRKPDAVLGDPEDPADHQGRGVVMLVEDQEGVRRSTTRILETAGYEVRQAEDGVAALELYPDVHIDILVTDVIMPRGVSGKDLADRLRMDRPDLPVVFVSGYSAHIISERGILPPSTGLVMKPFTPQAILEAIADAMNAPVST
jgi:signal transduction histidine kinase/CheY-like chemotaxis protein